MSLAIRVGVIVFSIFIYSCEHKLRDCEQNFNAELWKETYGGQLTIENPRECMVKEVIDEKLFIGLSKTEITDKFGSMDRYSNNKTGYTIREFYSSDIDPDTMVILIVEFDSSGVSTHTYLRDDI